MNLAVGTTVGRRETGRGPMVIAAAAFLALATAAVIAVVAWQVTANDAAKPLPKTDVRAIAGPTAATSLLYIVRDEAQAARVQAAEQEAEGVRISAGAEDGSYHYEVFVADDEEMLNHLQLVFLNEQDGPRIVDLR